MYIKRMIDMIKTDLITGFLGAGKTTFLKKYVSYLLSQGIRVGILVNDYGAVNVDVMLLSELEKNGCLIESVAGACDRNCHKRRFKTKLIALAMSGCQRVVIEPSGLFDTDEFFDSLREDPLDRWYEIGSILTIADAGLEETLSPFSEYMLASQCANAGKIILSKSQIYSSEAADHTVSHISSALKSVGCGRDINSNILCKNWDDFTEQDMKIFMNCGHVKGEFVKKFRNSEGFTSVYFMNSGIGKKEAAEKAGILLNDKQYGSIFRVKGFIPDSSGWFELNASEGSITLNPAQAGQEIIIVIGEHLQKDKINQLFGGC